MKKSLFRVTVIAVICLAVMSTLAFAQPQNELYQVSTINALMQGVYDGERTIKDLKAHGNFGIGTFNHLDGELIGIDGKFYQVKSTGQVVLVDDNVKVPFANVLQFKSEQTSTIRDVASFHNLESKVDGIITDRNYFYAIRIDGVFKTMKTRSVPAQSKPYKTLTEAAKDQAVFQFENIKGTIFGFWCPQFVNGINVPGYHLHFISDDRKYGGHILDVSLESATIQTAHITNFSMQLPDDGDYRQVNLEKDLSKEIQKVEK